MTCLGKALVTDEDDTTMQGLSESEREVVDGSTILGIYGDNIDRVARFARQNQKAQNPSLENWNLSTKLAFLDPDGINRR